ncbi:hypothetical protein [Clostridium diolis]|uniref:hypothetical protein n=1 Tax=Clostridium diolis TaxID=223919 RepID=UPI003AF720E9
MGYIFILGELNDLTIYGTSVNKVGRTLFITNFGCTTSDISLRSFSVKFIKIVGNSKFYEVALRRSNNA